MGNHFRQNILNQEQGVFHEEANFRSAQHSALLLCISVRFNSFLRHSAESRTVHTFEVAIRMPLLYEKYTGWKDFDKIWNRSV
jgi:hypothetical protein